MNLLLLSTCGTSVLTNGMPDDVRRWLVNIANRLTLDGDEASRLENIAAKRKAEFLSSDPAAQRRLSAEMNGIAAVLARYEPDRVQHVLVHTDTAVGRAAKDIVAASLSAAGHQVQFLTAGGLRTDDAAAFREAVADLTGSIEELARWRDNGWTFIFSLTGGFKAFNAYLQALGMIHADRCVFLFENSPELIEIPRLPVVLADVETVRRHLTAFRRMDLGYPVGPAEVAGVPESLLLVDGNQVTTSVWGDVVWKRARKEIYAPSVLEPLSPKLKFASIESLNSAFASLPEERRVQVNEALDALSGHLDGVRKLLKSETFKMLQGDPRPPSTHEMYAWSGHGAGRLFGHFENGAFIVDKLGGHL